ncbi:MAG TPA: hypothetical protein VHY20_05040, partial [Pirellulales bacterium]|nr:hypothetical protein [Pirellulales bacterium]
GEVKVPVVVLRHNNYAEQVILLTSPQVPGVKVTVPVIAPGKSAGELLVSVGPETPPGVYRFNVRCQAKFRELDVEMPFTLTVK